MTTFQIISWRAHLLGRGSGRDLLQVLRDASDDAAVLQVDFEGVESMSWSFADECFGELYEERQQGNPDSVLRFVNATDDQESRLRQVLARRAQLVAV